MRHRFVGPSNYRLLVPALVVAAAAAAVALALGATRGRDTGGRPEPSITVDRNAEGSTGTTSTTAPPVANPTVTSPVSDVGVDSDGVHRWLWADPAALRLVWQDENGAPYGQLQAARRALEHGGERVVAITNGGIYRPDLVPSGLYVEDGRELRPLNQASGSGNFFLKPNGVFWLGGGRAGVETTEQYAAVAADRSVEAAVQSGPMLVIDSEINAAFSETSTSTFRRNAVGVDAAGRVLLIMADRPVTLWAFATRCRELGAVDALYLDGSLSRLEFPAADRPIFPNVPVASMIAVVEG